MFVKRLSVRAVALIAVVCGALAGSAWFGAQIDEAANTPTAYAIPAGDDDAPLLFVALDAYRTYDSRLAEPVPNKLSPGGMGLFAVGRVLLPDGSQTNEPSPVPDGAAAVTFTVTVTDTESAGFVQVARPVEADGSTSNVNWTGPGQTEANSGVSRLEIDDDGSLVLGFVMGGATDARAHMIVDITGYYIPAAIG